jgi:transposase
MFIRTVKRTEKKTGKTYTDYRLVESVRTPEGKVSQRLLLNLGATFSLPKEKWRLLSQRIEFILSGQLELFESDNDIESQAQYYARKIINKQSTKYETPKKTSLVESRFETVDVNNIHSHTIRTIGGEHVTLWAIRELALETKLAEMGFTETQIQISIGQIIARLLNPGSELSTHKWLQNQSGLNELLDCDFSAIGRDQLYRVSDKLMDNKKAIERSLYQRERDLFQQTETITLYDLTNTYIEGSGVANEKATFGRSKEKRYDCRLVTLALVLDGEGFPKRSEILAGNISEPATLKELIDEVSADGETSKPTIICDAGIATEKNLAWLKDNNYDYIVVSRKAKQPMPEGEQVIVKDKGEDIVTVTRVSNEENNEVELYCHSVRKAEKEQSMHDQKRLRFEEGLEKIAAGLQKKNGMKASDKVLERIGRLKEKYKQVARFYVIEHTKSEDTKKITAITWKKQRTTDKSAIGVYCLRTSRRDLDAQTIWTTYTSLSDVESAFRCMKSELGMRPIYHQKTERVDGHLFITLLGYHIQHYIRYKLKEKNIHASWTTIRTHLNTQVRLTTTMKCRDDKAVHVRKSSVPDIAHRKIYDALDLAYYPGRMAKTLY